MTIPRAFSTAAWCALAIPAALLAQVPVNAGTNATMVVSATKASENALDVAAPVSVVSGDELRRHGAKTVAEALQDLDGRASRLGKQRVGDAGDEQGDPHS